MPKKNMPQFVGDGKAYALQRVGIIKNDIPNIALFDTYAAFPVVQLTAHAVTDNFYPCCPAYFQQRDRQLRNIIVYQCLPRRISDVGIFIAAINHDIASDSSIYCRRLFYLNIVYIRLGIFCQIFHLDNFWWVIVGALCCSERFDFGLLSASFQLNIN